MGMAEALTPLAPTMVARRMETGADAQLARWEAGMDLLQQEKEEEASCPPIDGTYYTVAGISPWKVQKGQPYHKKKVTMNFKSCLRSVLFFASVCGGHEVALLRAYGHHEADGRRTVAGGACAVSLRIMRQSTCDGAGLEDAEGRCIKEVGNI